MKSLIYLSKFQFNRISLCFCFKGLMIGYKIITNILLMTNYVYLFLKIKI